MDGLECSEIMLSSLERTLRIDAEFYKKGNLQVDTLLSTWKKWILQTASGFQTAIT